MARLLVPQKGNPYFSNLVGSVTATIGAEDSNTITLALQARRGDGTDVSQRAVLDAYWSKDANGDVPATGLTLPAGGYAAGTDGTLVAGPLDANRITTAPVLAIDAVPEKYKLITNTVIYNVYGVPCSKAPATAIAFTAAHVVSAAKFGVVLIQINAAGTPSSKVPLATQAYTSAALALAALPAPDAGNVALGYIAIAAGVAAWTATTDDMTNGSDVTTATFVSAPANGIYAPTFRIVTEADGDADIVITDTRVWTHYLQIRYPSGAKVAIGPAAFA